MTARTILRLCAPFALVAAGAVVSAQALLPSVPPKQFGGSVTPAFEGWYDNPDGTHSFLIGYFSRNTEHEVDIPIGPNNHFEPGGADMGQPTHFLTGRRYGMFVFTMPKEFTKQQKLTWVLTANGVTTAVPVYMSPDYNVTPNKSSEASPDGGYNVPPVLRFSEPGPSFMGPVANPAHAISRTAVVAEPMALTLLADDDAKFSSGSNAPLRNPPPPVSVTVSKYRGAGTATFGGVHPKFETIKGGKPDQPYSGKASTTVTFSEPGDYMLHVTANDYSDNGGGGSVCCWTTALVKVAVKAAASSTTSVR
ncbi:MAG: hypothetical protein HY048_08715 [Acidobacteria bacterium]|nr:hypothetical protein [Acidobacteriota bacterium]